MSSTAAVGPLSSGGLQAMVGSLEQLGPATLFAVPLGIVTAVFLAEVGGKFAENTPGHLVESGPTEQVFESPIDGRTADYVHGRFG